MNIRLQQQNDQLLSEIREYALANEETILENEHMLKALMCCMLSQWINERIEQ